MAKKSKSEIQNKINLLKRLKYEIALRISGYKELYDKLQELRSTCRSIDDWLEYCSINKDFKKIFNRAYSVNLSKPWQDMNIKSCMILTPESYRFARLKKTTETSKQYLDRILEDQKYLTLEIDTSIDKEIILFQIADILNSIMKEKKQAGHYKKANIQLPLFKRYFAVWDLRNNKEHTWTDKLIAQKLIKEGWYTGKTLKQVENSISTDYETAEKLIGITLKEEKKQKNKKPIMPDKTKKDDYALFEKYEKILEQEGLGTDDVYYSSKKQIKNWSPDGVIKEKIKRKTSLAKRNKSPLKSKNRI